MKVAQAVYWIGALWRDLNSALIPMENLISTPMSKQAGPLSEMLLEYWRELGRCDEIFPYELNVYRYNITDSHARF